VEGQTEELIYGTHPVYLKALCVTTCYCNMHFNAFLQFGPWLSWWPLSSRFPHDSTKSRGSCWAVTVFLIYLTHFTA